MNPTNPKHEMESRRALHEVKCVVLAMLANDLRYAILGDMENLRFELGAADLISEETRNSKDAGAMVSEIQNRLRTDELVWSKLITVLGRCRKEALCSKLEDCLRREESERSSCMHAERGRAGKFVRKQELYTCYGSVLKVA